MKYSLKVPVIKVEQPIGEFFIASMNAKDVAGISYSDVRRVEKEARDVETYLGVQRPLDQKRVKEIKKYLESSQATFPSTVILAIDERCVEYDSEKRELSLFPYHSDDESIENSIPYEQIASVLDGQHRIECFTEDGNNHSIDMNDDFQLAVSIFVGADLATQANIFATVNLAQTKVNKSLAYDLFALSKSRSPFKSAHSITLLLDENNSSPFYKRIKRLGVRTPGRKYETLTLQVFVEAILKLISDDPVSDRNKLQKGYELEDYQHEKLSQYPLRRLFLAEKEAYIAKIIYNYFSAIKNKWPSAWDNVSETGNLLPKANSFNAFMRYFRTHGYKYACKEQYGEVPSIERFSELFAEIDMKDEDFNRVNLPPGSGGATALYKVLTREIKDFSEL